MILVSTAELFFCFVAGSILGFAFALVWMSIGEQS
jgi:hypothetical protein